MDKTLVLGDVSLCVLKEENLKELILHANNINIWNSVRDYFPHPYTLKDAKNYLEHVSVQAPVRNFSIKYKNQFCGMIGAEPQEGVYRLSAEMGYWIGESFWGKGIATNAVQLIRDYTFNTMGMARIFSSVFEFNEGSKRVLEKNGFKLDCIKQNAVIKNGKLINEFAYSIINNDFQVL